MDHAAFLHQAAHRLGGEEVLRRALGVSWLELQSWLQAEASVPPVVFLRVVDVLASAASPNGERAAVAPAHPFLGESAPPAPAEELIERALEAAIEATHADFGNLQLLEPDGALRIRAQRGFEAPFLDFFAAVCGPESACGVAMMTGKPFGVSDVARSDVLRGPAAETLLAAGVRAVQSTPIFTPARRPLGVLSVHFHEPGLPDERSMALLAAIARRAGALLAA